MNSVYGVWVRISHLDPPVFYFRFVGTTHPVGSASTWQIASAGWRRSGSCAPRCAAGMGCYRRSDLLCLYWMPAGQRTLGTLESGLQDCWPKSGPHRTFQVVALRLSSLHTRPIVQAREQLWKSVRLWVSTSCASIGRSCAQAACMLMQARAVWTGECRNLDRRADA